VDFKSEPFEHLSNTFLEGARVEIKQPFRVRSIDIISLLCLTLKISDEKPWSKRRGELGTTVEANRQNR
jgi:hypothetical protein